jgi:hypothetical protein
VVVVTAVCMHRPLKKLPKVNRKLAERMQSKGKSASAKKQHADTAAALMGDNRFSALWNDPNFVVDERSDEFARLNPSSVSMRGKQQKFDDDDSDVEKAEGVQAAEEEQMGARSVTARQLALGLPAPLLPCGSLYCALVQISVPLRIRTEMLRTTTTTTTLRPKKVTTCRIPSPEMERYNSRGLDCSPSSTVTMDYKFRCGARRHAKRRITPALASVLSLRYALRTQHFRARRVC